MSAEVDPKGGDLASTLAAADPHSRVVGGEGAQAEEPLEERNGGGFEEARVAAHGEGLVAEGGGR